MKKLLISLLLVPGILHAQRLFNLANIQEPPTSPTIIVSPTSLSFASQAGTASSPQTITYSFINTTAASNSVTLPGFVESSIDGGSTWHTGFAGQSNCTNCSALIRVAAATTTGNYGPSNASFSSTTVGTTTQSCSVTASVGSLSTSPSSITGLNGTSGTAGTPQTVTVTFVNVNISASAPISTEISKDGGSTYSTAQTLSTGSPLGLLIRTQAASGPGAISGNLILSGTGLTTVNVPISGTVSSGGKDSMRVQHYITAADTVPGWTHVFGDPSDSVISRVGGNNHTITYSTLNPSFYGQLGGVGIGANNGLPSTTTFPAGTKALSETVQSGNLFDTTKHMAQFSGLIPGHTYKVVIGAVFSFNLNLLSKWDVAGTVWATAINQSCNGTTNPNPLQNVFTVTAPASGIVLISWGKNDSGQVAGGFSAITITEQSFPWWLLLFCPPFIKLKKRKMKVVALLLLVFLSFDCIAQDALSRSACTFKELKTLDSLSMKLTGSHTRYFQERNALLAPFRHDRDSLIKAVPDTAKRAELLRFYWNNRGCAYKLKQLDDTYNLGGCIITGEPYSHPLRKGEYEKN